MKIEAKRYQKRIGNRETDLGSFVTWEIEIINNEIIIKTESGIYKISIK